MLYVVRETESDHHFIFSLFKIYESEVLSLELIYRFNQIYILTPLILTYDLFVIYQREQWQKPILRRLQVGPFYFFFLEC